MEKITGLPACDSQRRLEKYLMSEKMFNSLNGNSCWTCLGWEDMRKYIYIYTFWDLHEFSKGWLFSKIHHLEWAESAENWFSPPYQQVQVVNLGNRIPIIYCLFITYYGPPPSINNQIFCNYNHYGYIIRFRGKKQPTEVPRTTAGGPNAAVTQTGGFGEGTFTALGVANGNFWVYQATKGRLEWAPLVGAFNCGVQRLVSFANTRGF